MNPLLARIQSSLQAAALWVQGRRVLVLSILATLLLLAGGWIGWSLWSDDKEKKLSAEVNRLALEQAQLFQMAAESFTAQERLDANRKTLADLGEKNLRFENGLRALYLAANTDWRYGDLNAARAKYLKIADRKRSFLAGNALYLAILTWEEQGNTEDLLQAASRFEKNFATHYLLAEVRISKARMLMSQGKAAEAMALLDKLENDKGSEAQVARVKETKRLLSIRAQIAAASARQALPVPGR